MVADSSDVPYKLGITGARETAPSGKTPRRGATGAIVVSGKEGLPDTGRFPMMAEPDKQPGP